MSWGARSVRVGQVLRLAADPEELWDRLTNIVEIRNSRPRNPRRAPDNAVQSGDAWLHAMLDVPWPCPEVTAFAPFWGEIESLLRKETHWVDPRYDADVALARAAWCLTRHLRPHSVVETGVARGVTSRVVLEALEANQAGHLWSIDLPPLALAFRAGFLVPARGRHRWTYLRGSSRRCLPRLLARLPSIDLFIHDSLHSEANLRFELTTVWPWLCSGGVALVDDVDYTSAFAAFVRPAIRARALVVSKAAASGLFGILLKEAGPEPLGVERTGA